MCQKIKRFMSWLSLMSVMLCSATPYVHIISFMLHNTMSEKLAACWMSPHILQWTRLADCGPRSYICSSEKRAAYSKCRTVTHAGSAGADVNIQAYLNKNIHVCCFKEHLTGTKRGNN